VRIALPQHYMFGAMNILRREFNSLIDIHYRERPQELTGMRMALSKILDLDHLMADLQNLQFANALTDLRNLSLANPVEFASGIDNFKLLPWPMSVALAFYLPWLEIACALGLVFRFLYRGALALLITLIVVFTLAITAAKLRGLDITCGCFGHVSQNWSFPSHLATNLAILAALLALGISNRLRKPL